MKRITFIAILFLSAATLSAQQVQFPVALVQRLTTPVTQVTVRGNVNLDIVQDTANFVLLKRMMQPDQVAQGQFPDSLVCLNGQELIFGQAPKQGELQLHLSTQHLQLNAHGTSLVRLRGVDQADTLRYTYLEMRSFDHAHHYVASPCVTDSVIAVANDQSVFLHEYLYASHIGVDFEPEAHFQPLTNYVNLEYADLLSHEQKEGRVNARYFIGMGYMLHADGAALQNGEVLPTNPLVHYDLEIATTFLRKGKWFFDGGYGICFYVGSFGKQRVNVSQNAEGQYYFAQQASSGAGTWHTNSGHVYLTIPLSATCHATDKSWFSLSLLPKITIGHDIIQRYRDDGCMESHTYRDNDWRTKGGCDLRLTYGFRSLRLYTQVSPFTPYRNNTQRYVPFQFGVMISIVE